MLWNEVWECVKGQVSLCSTLVQYASRRRRKLFTHEKWLLYLSEFVVIVRFRICYIRPSVRDGGWSRATRSDCNLCCLSGHAPFITNSFGTSFVSSVVRMISRLFGQRKEDDRLCSWQNRYKSSQSICETFRFDQHVTCKIQNGKVGKMLLKWFW